LLLITANVSRRFNAVYALLWRVLQDSPNGARTTLTLKRVRSILFNITISNGLKCSYLEVIKVTQFFEFFQFKNNNKKFERFCGLRFAKPTSVKQLAIIVFIDCCKECLIFHSTVIFPFALASYSFDLIFIYSFTFN
jgi:hypothetical protein